jgi:hypothetical protein
MCRIFCLFLCKEDPPVSKFIGSGGVSNEEGLDGCGKIVEVVAFKVEELPFDIADFFS